MDDAFEDFLLKGSESSHSGKLWTITFSLRFSFSLSSFINDVTVAAISSEVSFMTISVLDSGIETVWTVSFLEALAGGGLPVSWPNFSLYFLALFTIFLTLLYF